MKFLGLHILVSLIVLFITITLFAIVCKSVDISGLLKVKIAIHGALVLILIFIDFLVFHEGAFTYKNNTCLEFVAILLNLLTFQIIFSVGYDLVEKFFGEYSAFAKRSVYLLLSNLFLAPVVTQTICLIIKKFNIGLNAHQEKIIHISSKYTKYWCCRQQRSGVNFSSYLMTLFFSILTLLSTLFVVFYLKYESNSSTEYFGTLHKSFKTWGLNVLTTIMMLVAILADLLYFIYGRKYLHMHASDDLKKLVQTKTDYTVQLFLVLISMTLVQISNIQIWEIDFGLENFLTPVIKIDQIALFKIVQSFLFVLLAAVRVSTLLSAQLFRSQLIGDLQYNHEIENEYLEKTFGREDLESKIYDSRTLPNDTNC